LITDYLIRDYWLLLFPVTLLELHPASAETRLVSTRFHRYSFTPFLFRSHYLHDFLGQPASPDQVGHDPQESSAAVTTRLKT
jgi:hypothetical protein